MLAKSVSTLAYAVRGRVVLKLCGQISVSLAAMTAVSALVALVAGEPAFAWRFAAVTGLLVGLGLPAGRIQAPRHIQLNEALSVTALTFLVAALALAWPFTAAGLSPLDALFEAVSAITTTGLSTLTHVEQRSAAFLFARAWGQWYGGLAIVVLALALVLTPGEATRRLSALEGSEDLLGGTRARARYVLVVYALLTAAGVLVLVLAGVGWFDALVHGLAAVSTGGFSSHDASLAGLGAWPARAAVILLSLAGAVSLSLYYRGWRQGWRAFFADRELLWLVVAGLVTSVLLAATMAPAGRWGAASLLADAPLIAFSAQSTAGFTTLPIAELPAASKLVLIGAMFVGGDMGSTAGGIKILRLLVVLYLAYRIVVRAGLAPHAMVEQRVAGRRLGDAELQAAVTTVLWYAIVVVLSWLPFLALGSDPLDALFEVVSALGTVGLSSGITGPALHPVLKGVLCLDMLLGRLEVVALLVLIYPRTWLGRREESA